MIKEDGKIANSKERPDCLADYFEKHWGINHDRNKKVTTMKLFFHYMSNINIGEITMKGLIETVKNFKNNKSPGPDGIPMEFFKFLDAEGLDCILDILNDCWENNIMPEHMELANVVTLYKKGKFQNLANYRPIALLQSIYKIYATILQQRLANGGIEEKLWKNQYGFRKKLSTSMPLFISRRIQDYAEHSYDKLFLVFLDWEKAFDKVDQTLLVRAMERLNIPDKIIKVLGSLYVDTKFRIKNKQGYSSYRRQNAGIRQGCPLSPYLFICLMTVGTAVCR